MCVLCVAAAVEMLAAWIGRYNIVDRRYVVQHWGYHLSRTCVLCHQKAEAQLTQVAYTKVPMCMPNAHQVPHNFRSCQLRHQGRRLALVVSDFDAPYTTHYVVHFSWLTAVPYDHDIKSHCPIYFTSMDMTCLKREYKVQK